MGGGVPGVGDVPGEESGAERVASIIAGKIRVEPGFDLERAGKADRRRNGSLDEDRRRGNDLKVGQGVGNIGYLAVLFPLAIEDAVSTADDELGSCLPGEPEPGREVLVVTLNDGA